MEVKLQRKPVCNEENESEVQKETKTRDRENADTLTVPVYSPFLGQCEKKFETEMIKKDY